MLMPGKPQEQTREVKAGENKLDIHFYVAAPAVDRIVYVTWTEYPAKVVEGKQDAHLEGTVKGNLTNLKAKMLEGKKITVGEKKYPGRDILLELPDGKLYRARIVLAGTRLYQVVANGAAEFVKGKQTDEYIESFKVTD